MVGNSDKFDRYEDGSVVFPNGKSYDPELHRVRPPLFQQPPPQAYGSLTARLALANLLRAFLPHIKAQGDLNLLLKKMGAK